MRDTGDLKKKKTKKHLINASMLITHKGKNCLIISTNLCLRWTVVLCSCACSSSPHCLSAAAASTEQSCLFNPGMEDFLYFYSSSLVCLFFCPMSGLANDPHIRRNLPSVVGSFLPEYWAEHFEISGSLRHHPTTVLFSNLNAWKELKYHLSLHCRSI